MTADEPSQEGTITYSLPSLDQPCFTYYKVYGDLHSGLPPVIVLHGGPGSGHEYMLPFRHLWFRYRFPVIMYDQIGCAKSIHLRDTVDDYSLWVNDTFIAELENLLAHFHLNADSGPGYHILGHSWGGMLASVFAARHPPGLRRLVLVGASANIPMFREEIWQLKDRLPAEHVRAIEEAVLRTHDYSSDAYKAALHAFLEMYLCRARPFPPEELAIDFANHADDGTVRMACMGDCAFTPGGSMTDWSAIPVLPDINVPTFVLNGEFDSSQELSSRPFFEHIPRVRWVTLAGASHMGHLDSPEMLDKILRLVRDFLSPSGYS